MPGSVCREYWIVDPDVQTVAVLALSGNIFVPVPGAQGAIQSRLISGLSLALEDVFLGVER